MNDEIKKYIANERTRGVSDDAIKNELLAKGWKEEDVNAVMGIAGSVPAVTPPTELSSAADLFSATLKEFKDHFFMVLSISAAPILCIIAGAMMMVFSFAGLLFILLGIIMIVLASVALMRQINERWTLSFLDAYTSAGRIIFGMLWVSLLTGAVMMGGMLILFLPLFALTFLGSTLGFLKSVPMAVVVVFLIAYSAFALLCLLRLFVWFLFPKYAFVFDHIRGMSALSYSRELTRNIEGKVLWRLIAVMLPVIVISMIPIVGQLVTVFLATPFVVIYIAKLYDNVKLLKGAVPIQTETKERTIALVLLWVGCVAIIGSFIFIIGAIWYVQPMRGAPLGVPGIHSGTTLSMSNTDTPSILGSLDTARMKSRDARRISDIGQIGLALELYFDTHKGYPANLADLVYDKDLPSELHDPLDNTPYTYELIRLYDRLGGVKSVSYALGASLENDQNTVLQFDKDVTGTLVHGNDAAGCKGEAGRHCYDVGYAVGGSFSVPPAGGGG